MSEINDYYTRLKPALDEFTPDEVVKATMKRTESKFSHVLMRVYGWATKVRKSAPWLFLPGLFAVAIAEICLLKFLLLFRRKGESQLHTEGKPFVREFVHQYPFGAYVIVWKAIQLPYLRRSVARYRNSVIVEAAIGEGTLSQRVFDPDFSVTGLDINPISLLKATSFPHVKRSIVCDVMQPPLQPRSADLLISNNFLHHVSNKKGALQAWSGVADNIIFNDCTPLWSEALPPSYICHKIGLHGLAKKLAHTVDILGSQCLLPREELDRDVREAVEVVEETSYFSRFTFFLANVPSICFLHMGPIPQEIRDTLAKSFLGSWAESLTTTLCELLIDFDQTEKRDNDVSIIYVCKSKTSAAGKARPASILKCKCGAELPDTGTCSQCGKVYPKIDGMLFLLGDEMAGIADTYNSAAAAAFPKEHL